MFRVAWPLHGWAAHDTPHLIIYGNWDMFPIKQNLKPHVKALSYGWTSLLKEELGTRICNCMCSKLELTRHILSAHSSCVRTCGEVVLFAPTGHTTEEHLPRVASPKSTTYYVWLWLLKEKPHLRILLAVPRLSAAVCVWLWLSSSVQKENQMFPVRPSCDSGAVTVAFRENCIILHYGECGSARKVGPLKNECQEKPHLIMRKHASVLCDSHCFGI